MHAIALCVLSVFLMQFCLRLQRTLCSLVTLWVTPSDPFALCDPFFRLAFYLIWLPLSFSQSTIAAFIHN